MQNDNHSRSPRPSRQGWNKAMLARFARVCHVVPARSATRWAPAHHLADPKEQINPLSKEVK
jgi:hypothetical protein